MKKIAKKVKALIPAVAILAISSFAAGCFKAQTNDDDEEMAKASKHSKNTERVKEAGQDKVQLWEDGPYWATCNVGAEKPEESGLYFCWGDTEGYRYDEDEDTWVASIGSNDDFEFAPNNTPTFGLDISDLKRKGWIVEKNGDYVLAPEHDAAHAHWGGKWRMPTIDELKTLREECKWKWTTHNGVSGYVIRGRGEFKKNKIFVPAAGFGVWSSLNFAGSNGGFWSSVPDEVDSEGARGILFDSDIDAYWVDRVFGLPVRPVQGVADKHTSEAKPQIYVVEELEIEEAPELEEEPPPDPPVPAGIPLAL